MTHIPTEEIKQPRLHEDTLGFTFVWKGHFLRGVYPNSEYLAKSYFETGFLDEVVNKGLFPKTWISEFENEQFCMILEHEMIAPVLYSTEWNSAMLKDAALMVIDIARIGLSYGYNMVDCHKLNVMFKEGKPVYVDLGSFVPKEEGATGWHPYTNYTTSYYYILAMWCAGARQIAKRMMAPGVVLNTKDYYVFKNPLYRLFPSLTNFKDTFVSNICYLSSVSHKRICQRFGISENCGRSKVIKLVQIIVNRLKLSPSQHLLYLRWKTNRLTLKTAAPKCEGCIHIEEVETLLKRIGNFESVTFIDSPLFGWKELCEKNKRIKEIISIHQKDNDSVYEYRNAEDLEKQKITYASFLMGNGSISVRGKFPEIRLSSDVVVVLNYKLPQGSFGLHNAMVFFDRCKQYSASGALVVNIQNCTIEEKKELLELYFTESHGNSFLFLKKS